MKSALAFFAVLVPLLGAQLCYQKPDGTSYCIPNSYNYLGYSVFEDPVLESDVVVGKAPPEIPPSKKEEAGDQSDSFKSYFRSYGSAGSYGAVRFNGFVRVYSRSYGSVGTMRFRERYGVRRFGLLRRFR